LWKSRFNPGQSGELRLAAQGYYGKQLSDDTMNGVGLNSKESVFAIGPDLFNKINFFILN